MKGDLIMSIFPFRDSWEVWRQKVNEAIGSTEPIPASNITFDNSGTEVTATNVQGAVAEVAGDVASVAGVVGDDTDGLVKDVIDLQEDVINLQNIEITNGVKNYLPNVGNTVETNGITFTKNSDGSVTANGTATANATYRMIGSDTSKPLALPTNKYIISGCPNDASNEKYWMVFSWTEKPTSYVYDSPVEVEVSPSNPTNAGIVIKSGVTVDNVTFYPMIRLATDTDPTYQPYAKTNKELTKDVNGLSGKLVQIGGGHPETYTPATSETWAVKIGKLSTQMQAILESIADDERIRITEIILGSTVVQSNTASHLLSKRGSVYGDFSAVESNSSGYTVIRTVKVAMVDTDNMYVFTQINNTTAVLTVEDRSSTSNTTSVGFRYEIYKLLS